MKVPQGHNGALDGWTLQQLYYQGKANHIPRKWKKNTAQGHLREHASKYQEHARSECTLATAVQLTGLMYSWTCTYMHAYVADTVWIKGAWICWNLFAQEIHHSIFSVPNCWVRLHFVVQVGPLRTGLALKANRYLSTSLPAALEGQAFFEPFPISSNFRACKNLSRYYFLPSSCTLTRSQSFSQWSAVGPSPFEQNVQAPNHMPPQNVKCVTLVHGFSLDSHKQIASAPDTVWTIQREVQK